MSRFGRRYIYYEWEVSPDVDTPLAPGTYGLAIFEGGTYRNLASRRKYTILSLDIEDETITYEYTRGAGESVVRTGPPAALAVVEAVGDTPPAILARPDKTGGVA